MSGLEFDSSSTRAALPAELLAVHTAEPVYGHTSFAQAERELRRVHALEAARGLVHVALWSARAAPLGGANRVWPLPRLEQVLGDAREELLYARRDAALHVELLARCVEAPREDWPDAIELAQAAHRLHPGVEQRLALAFVGLSRARPARAAAIDVLATCVRPWPRALALVLLGFGALLEGDPRGARTHFDDARRARPGDPRLTWLAWRSRVFVPALAREPSPEGAPAALRRAFEIAAARGRGGEQRPEAR